MLWHLESLEWSRPAAFHTHVVFSKVTLPLSVRLHDHLWGFGLADGYKTGRHSWQRLGKDRTHTVFICITISLRHWITVLLDHCVTGSLYYWITVMDHCITGSLRHWITVLLDHCVDHGFTGSLFLISQHHYIVVSPHHWIPPDPNPCTTTLHAQPCHCITVLLCHFTSASLASCMPGSPYGCMTLSLDLWLTASLYQCRSSVCGLWSVSQPRQVPSKQMTKADCVWLLLCSDAATHQSVL